MKNLNKYLPVGIAIAGLIGLAYILNRVFRGSGVSALDAARKNTGTPTLSPVQLSSLADRIEAAGLATLGTDEEAIFQVFEQLKNQADLDGLIVAFGERRLEFTLGTSTLPAFLESELSSDDIELIIKSLKRKGIEF